MSRYINLRKWKICITQKLGSELCKYLVNSCGCEVMETISGVDLNVLIACTPPNFYILLLPSLSSLV